LPNTFLFPLDALISAPTPYCDISSKDVTFFLRSRADAEEDIRFYTALLTLNPKMVEDYIKRGNAYCYIGEYTKAIADYSAAIALKPNHLKAYYRRGVAYAKNTEYAKAISDYNEVIQRAPKQAEVYQRRGEAWYRLKEQEKANADLRVAKKLEMEEHM